MCVQAQDSGWQVVASTRQQHSLIMNRPPSAATLGFSQHAAAAHQCMTHWNHVTGIRSVKPFLFLTTCAFYTYPTISSLVSTPLHPYRACCGLITVLGNINVHQGPTQKACFIHSAPHEAAHSQRRLLDAISHSISAWNHIQLLTPCYSQIFRHQLPNQS